MKGNTEESVSVDVPTSKAAGELDMIDLVPTTNRLKDFSQKILVICDSLFNRGRARLFHTNADQLPLLCISLIDFCVQPIIITVFIHITLNA